MHAHWSSDVCLCACGCAAYEGFRARALLSKYRPVARVGIQIESTGGVATRKAEASRGALQRAIAS
jgi:hypothetical protein